MNWLQFFQDNTNRNSMKNLMFFASFPFATAMLGWVVLKTSTLPWEPFAAYLACYGGLYGYGKWVDYKAQKAEAEEPESVTEETTVTAKSKKVKK